MEDTEVWRNDELPVIDVTATVTEELGSELNVLFAIDAPPVETEDVLAAAGEDEDELPLLEDGRAVLCARVDARSTCRPGDRIRLSVDPRRFHFFDPESGIALTTDPVPAAALPER
jgi:multiple sugar transport system ATP-binding protein